MTELVLPNDTNMFGNLLGGRLMHWIDIAAALAAAKRRTHLRHGFGGYEINFNEPIRLGDVVKSMRR